MQIITRINGFEKHDFKSYIHQDKHEVHRGDLSNKECDKITSKSSNLNRTLPLGLYNNDQNMCFLNSLLQCLIRNVLFERFLCNINLPKSEILEALRESKNYLLSDRKAYFASHAVDALSVAFPDLVSPLGIRSKQQDTAELALLILFNIKGELRSRGI